MAKHTHRSKGPCLRCDEQRAELHPELRPWWDFVVETDPEAHMSDAWRSKDEQNDAFNRGASRRRWPDSKHNFMKDGKPCAKAFDCFRQTIDGKGEWKPFFYIKLAAALKKVGAPVKWAGEWVGKFREMAHFELEE